VPGLSEQETPVPRPPTTTMDEPSLPGVLLTLHGAPFSAEDIADDDSWAMTLDYV
jgi:hypothetical protein